MRGAGNHQIARGIYPFSCAPFCPIAAKSILADALVHVIDMCYSLVRDENIWDCGHCVDIESALWLLACKRKEIFITMDICHPHTCSDDRRVKDLQRIGMAVRYISSFDRGILSRPIDRGKTKNKNSAYTWSPFIARQMKSYVAPIDTGD
jgi:hypothetical protein